MYEQKYPEVEDLVMVKVKQIAEMGAYVSLLEYNNIEGCRFYWSIISLICNEQTEESF